MNLLIDVEDLFEYARHNRRPSGIQRVVFEIARALAGSDGTACDVQLLRHDNGGRSFQPVDWPSVEQLFANLTGAAAEPAPSPAAQDDALPEQDAVPPAPVDADSLRLPQRVPLGRRTARAVIDRLPESARAPLRAAIGHQRAALGSVRDLAAVALSGAVRPLLRRPAVEPGGPEASPAPEPAEQDIAEAAPEIADIFDCAVAPGDALLLLGAPWFHPNYAELVARAKCEHAVRFAMLIYDLIPIRRPEWCVPELPGIFRESIDGLLPLADVILTISRATARDVVRYAAERGIAHPATPIVVPLGTGFDALIDGRAEHAERRALPPPGSYVLSVGTIEARKNHALLIRLWRRLLETMPPEAVPALVLAGSVGWLVADLMEQLRNTGMLQQRVVLIEDPTDAELQRLYAGCLFTVYASFYEGWGLPVSESLAFGRPCFVSGATSLPEAGGTLARYFDPENGDQAYRLIRDALENPADLARWRGRIAREFRPVSWGRSAAAVLDGLGAKQQASESSRSVAAT